MIIKITEISSGFANVSNRCVWGDGHEYSDRPGSAYDIVHNCILPDALHMKEYIQTGMTVAYPTDNRGRIFDTVLVQNGIIYIMSSDGKKYRLEESDEN